MKNNYILETFVSIVLVVLLVLLVNPMHFWMPSMANMLILGATFGVFAIFATLIIKEKAEDEREALHRSLAGRAAYLSGAVVLVVGIFYQSYKDNIDIWLLFALLVMIITKGVTRFYSEREM